MAETKKIPIPLPNMSEVTFTVSDGTRYVCVTVDRSQLERDPEGVVKAAMENMDGNLDHHARTGKFM